MADFDDLHLEDEDDEPLEAYCVRCKQVTEMEEPQPVWTRKGTPGTRGYCAVCGTVTFRMGRTPAHDRLKQPDAVRVGAPEAGTTRSRRGRPRKTIPATYINHAAADSGLAQQLAADLPSVGIQTWLPEQEQAEVAWAGGVHPALEECDRMVVILSPAALADEAVQRAWAFFREQRKPLAVALLDSVEVPDDLRRAPRIHFSGDYRRALRELVQALAE